MFFCDDLPVVAQSSGMIAFLTHPVWITFYLIMTRRA